MPLRFTLHDVALFERPVRFARPFRFGAVTINAAVQAFVRVEIEVEGKGRATQARAPSFWPRNGSTSGRIFHPKKPWPRCGAR